MTYKLLGKEYIDEDDFINTEVIGLAIDFGKVSYGVVVYIKEEITTQEIRYYAITDKDYAIDYAVIEQLFIMMNDRQKMLDNPNYLGTVYPDGSEYSKRVFGPRKKQIAKLIGSSIQIHPSQLDVRK